MYEKGKGVDKDYKKAFKWYELAAKQGQPVAQYNLGNMYERGEGLAKDDIQAFKYFSLASLNGNQEAKESKDALEKKMTPAQLEKAKYYTTQWLAQHKS